MEIQSIGKYYQDVIKSNGKWIKIAVIALISGFVVGWAAEMLHLALITDLIDQAITQVQELAETVVIQNTLNRILLIWQNNLIATAMMLFLGFVLGYLPFFSLFLNGLLLGMVCYTGIVVENQVTLLIWSILPHGIIEIPALIIAGAFGIKLGWQWLQPSAAGKRLKTLNDTALEAALIYLLVAFLLLIAAAIEGGIVFALMPAN